MTDTIRVGTLEDLAALADFNSAMAWETEQKQLDRPTLEAGLMHLLSDASAGFYLVAIRDDQVVAAPMVTYEWSDWRNGCFWWIQSVYVLPVWRRKGIFTQLYHAVKQLAAQRTDVCGLRLYVEQHNAVAQATYKSLGMAETHYDMYEIEL